MVEYTPKHFSFLVFWPRQYPFNLSALQPRHGSPEPLGVELCVFAPYVFIERAKYTLGRPDSALWGCEVRFRCWCSRVLGFILEVLEFFLKFSRPLDVL